MKNLVFVALALGGLSQAAGCVSSGGPSGQFNAAWMLTAGLMGDSGGCSAAGASSVTVHSDSANSSEKYEDVFNCSDGSGTTSALPLDDYNVWVEVDDANNNVIAESDTAQASLQADGDLIDVPTFSFPWDAGTFGLTWTLNGAQPDASTCQAVGSNTVHVTATLANSGGTGYDDMFDCSAGMGETSPEPVGDYTVVVDLEPSGGTSMPQNATLQYGNDFEDLGNFDFAP